MKADHASSTLGGDTPLSDSRWPRGEMLELGSSGISAERSETLSRRAYIAMRHAIREGRLARDTFYSEAAFARVLDISRTPVREALIELAREGVIEKVPQRGFRLRPISVADVHEAFDLRQMIESFVVRRAASHAAPGLIHDLRRIVGLQRDVISRDVSMALTMSEEFHLAMPKALGMERSYRALLTLRSAGWFSGASVADDRTLMRRAAAEHAAILEAIERTDEKEAVLRMKRHLRHTAEAAAKRLLLDLSRA